MGCFHLCDYVYILEVSFISMYLSLPCQHNLVLSRRLEKFLHLIKLNVLLDSPPSGAWESRFVLPATQEAEGCRCEFSLGNLARLCLKIQSEKRLSYCSVIGQVCMQALDSMSIP